MDLVYCSKCYSVFYEDMIESDICPKADCAGNLVRSHEILLPTIILLSQKGYRIENSYPGAVYCNDSLNGCHIKFSEDYSEIWSSLPDGFVWERNDNVIRKRFNVCTQRDAYLAVLSAARALFLWAESLNDFDEDNLAF